MAKETKISWAHHTFNSWWGCMKVSDGCKNCYAENLADRFGYPNIWGPAGSTERRTFKDKHWAEPLLWAKVAAALGERQRIFSGSMCDWAEDHPTANAERPKLWELIRQTPGMDWLLLTKRPENIPNVLPDDWGPQGYANVWLGTSIEDMRVAGRLDALAAVPAVVRFVSYEPALGPLDQLGAAVSLADWWIYGGESGPDFRQDQDDWARWLRDSCADTRTAFWYKQQSARKPGTRATLDGVEYHQLPLPRAA